MTVLLVEDNIFELNLAKAALSGLGFAAVLTSLDGKEAMEKLHKYANINLIVSDWNMPTMNGLQFLERVRETWPDVPFVMMTGNDSVEQVMDAKKAGVFAYVLKPFSMENLRKKIIAAVRLRIAMGDLSKNSAADEVYIKALEKINEFNDQVDDELTQNVPANIRHLEQTVEEALFSGGDKQVQLAKFREATEAIFNEGNLSISSQEIIQAISDNLAQFLEAIKIPTDLQTEVVKLNVETIFSISCDDETAFSSIDGNALIDGLRKAALRALT
jgi:two-component system chemotaxis response regulator CheY